MKPDRSNYEIWLVDYLDGNLSDERANELYSFLDENPDIREELSDILNYKIEPHPYKFRDKESLKKTAADLSEYQFEMLCVASLENDLSETQSAELNEILAASEEKRKTAATINRTKLNPPALNFRYKARMKKLTLSQKALRVSVAGIAAAAAVFILFTLITKPVISLPDNNPVATLADKKDKPEKVISEKPAVNESNQKQIIAVNTKPKNISKAVAQKTEEESMEVSPSMATDLTDSVLSSQGSLNNTIKKLEYRATLSVPDVKAGNDLVALNLIPVESVPPKEKPGLNESIAKFFREKILKTENPEKGSLKAYEVVDAGINGLNRLFGWNMKLEKKKDEKGEINSVYFNSRLLKFNAPVKKSLPSE